MRTDAAPLVRLARLGVDHSLPACMAFTLALIIGDVQAAAWPARIALIVYLISQWRAQSALARGLLITSLAIAVGIAVGRDDAPALLAHALDRFCFFATFVSALGMLRVAAMRSRLIREAGFALVRQRPGRRYPILALGTGLFGLIVNIGVLNLFGALIKRSNSLSAAGGRPHIRDLRERRMMLAMLRGFALVPLTSPLSITIAVILSNLESLTWFDIAPLAIPTGALVFGLGWLLDWLQGPTPSGLTPDDGATPSLAPMAHFALLALAITGAVFAISAIGELGLPASVLIACPVSAFVWLSLQRRRLGGTTGIGRATALLVRRAGPIFGANRIEVAVLGGSGFIGALVASLVNTQWLGDLLLASGLHGPAAAVAAMFLVATFAQLGMNPIVTATLLLGVLPHPALIGVSPVVLAIALMCAWALSMLSSPFTAVMLILSGLTGRSTYALTWRWNGLFFVLTAVMLAAWVALLATVIAPG